MMKDDVVYMGHMLDYARKVVAKTKRIDEADWTGDEDLQIIVVHLIQIIGEAARHVSEETKSKYLDIPWVELLGMRNRIVHNYVNIRLKIIWDVARFEIPKLVNVLEKIVPPEDFSE